MRLSSQRPGVSAALQIITQLETTHLSVLTLNCWGIGYVPFLKSPNRRTRIGALARHLEQSGNRYDFVFLQELWLQSDRDEIKASCSETLPHFLEFHGGVIGTGLLMLSRYPLLKPAYSMFSMNGFKHQIWLGDSLCGSGIGTAWTTLPNGLSILLSTSHYHAEYDRSHDEFLVDRVSQALEAQEVIAAQSEAADVVIYAGDLNTEPGDLPHRILTTLGGLQDTRDPNHVPGPSFNLAGNFYSVSKERAVTIDYILAKSSAEKTIKSSACRNPLPERIQDEVISYSNHEPVWATFEIGEATKEEDCSSGPKNEPSEPEILRSEIMSFLASERAKATWRQRGLIFLTMSFLVLLSTSLRTWNQVVDVGLGFTLALLLYGVLEGNQRQGAILARMERLAETGTPRDQG